MCILSHPPLFSFQLLRELSRAIGQGEKSALSLVTEATATFGRFARAIVKMGLRKDMQYVRKIRPDWDKHYVSMG